jgi:zinc transporter
VVERIVSRKSSRRSCGRATGFFPLTLVTVVALPFNVIGGLFDERRRHPLAQHRHGFTIVIAVVAGLTAVVGALVLRRRKDW